MRHLVEEKRERGSIESWNATQRGVGLIRADNGDTLVVFYWSNLRGFHQLRPGQRVEFSRTKLGALEAASLVVPVLTDADSN